MRVACNWGGCYTLGGDLGLREGNRSLGIVADFADEAPYRGYDLDGQPNRIRGLLAPPWSGSPACSSTGPPDRGDPTARPAERRGRRC